MDLARSWIKTFLLFFWTSVTEDGVHHQLGVYMVKVPTEAGGIVLASAVRIHMATYPFKSSSQSNLI